MIQKSPLCQLIVSTVLQKAILAIADLSPRLVFLHKSTFMQQYEYYWANSTDPKIMWIALLFSVLTMVMLSYHLIGDEPPEYEGISERLAEFYKLKTVQCVRLGDITKCAPFTVEALLYNGLAEQVTRSERVTDVWALFGIVLRLAIQMGYHR